MSPEQITDVVRQALFIALEISAPFLIIAMVVGLVVSLFQAVTQIHEMTLTFVPKVFIVTLALALLLPWILKTLSHYTLSLFVDQWNALVSLSHYAS